MWVDRHHGRGTKLTIALFLLAFETAQEYSVTIAVAIGVVVASLVTRRWFGYSFATWRFHLKGLDLRGAHDVGRLYELKVREIVDADILREIGSASCRERVCPYV